MSDPVTNAEVEDVLSSIRRLVSEDKRPVQAPKPEPATDRLVLTPALRVGSDDDATQDQPQPDGAEAAGGSQPDLSYTPESLVTHDAPLNVYEDAPAAALPEEHTTEQEETLFDDPAHDYTDDPYHFDDETDQDGDGDEVEIVLNQTAADPAPEPAEQAHEVQDVQEAVEETPPLLVLSPTEALTEQGDSAQPDADEAHPTTDETQTVPEEEAGTEPTALSAEEVKAATLTAKIAALETAIGQISETWEPDDPGDSDYAGTEPSEALTWQDDEPPIETAPQAAEVAQSPVTGPQDIPAQDMAGLGAIEDRFRDTPDDEEAAQVAAPMPPVTRSLDDLDESQLIDEEALRDLVSEIVRAELQGALGERITRNVRKLVRREIHRALVAQDLE